MTMREVLDRILRGGDLWRPIPATPEYMADLETRISQYQNALASTPSGHPKRVDHLSRLGGLLGQKFSYTVAMADLDAAVGLLKEAADAYPQGHPERATLLNLMAMLVVNKWGCFKDSVDDNEALNVAQAAFDATTEGHPCHAESKKRLDFFKAYMKSETGVPGAFRSLTRASHVFNALFAIQNAHASATTTLLAYLPTWVSKPAATLVAYFTDRISNRMKELRDQCGGRVETVDIDRMILMTQKELDSNQKNNEFKMELLSTLDNFLGEAADMDRMILRTRKELESNQKNNAYKLALLSTLGNLFGEKYLHTGDKNTIQEAVRLAQEVVDSTPEGHQDSAGRISNLGLQLGRRWQCCRLKEDLDGSITMTRTALQEPNLSPTVQPNLYFNLGARLGDEYTVARDPDILREAVKCLRKAIEIAPPEETNRSEFLVSLGKLLYDKYTQEEMGQDLEEAIRLTREAQALGQQNEVDKAHTSARLGFYLGSQFLRSGETGDLDRAIDETERGVYAVSSDHPEKLAWLNNLALQLGDRFSRSGAVADLERAIQIMHKGAIPGTRLGDPNRPSRLNNLALRLGDRYARVGALADLNEAIELMRATLTIEPQLSQSDQPLLLNNLSIRLAERWDHTGNENDLDEAVRRSREAVEKSRPDHQDITRWCINLGIHLAARYQLKGDQEAFKKANDAYHKAVNTIPDEHPYRAALFNNMGLLFAEKYTHSKKSEDINKAIGHSRDSVSATATNATSWAMRSRNLARQLYQRYLHEDKTEDRSESRELLIRSLRSSTASIKVRVAAGRDFIFTEDKLDDPQSYDILKQLVNLLPLLALPPLHNSDKHHLLSAAVGIASDAAAMALSFEKGDEGAFAAISCLETGRAIIAGGTFMAHDVIRLEKVDKSLAEKFVGLRDQLAGPEPTDTIFTSQIQDPSAQRKAIECKSAGLELDATLQQIRSLDGFERFLLPESQADIVGYASHGPIVMINLSKYRCDALIIQQSVVQSLSLPHVSLAEVESYGREPGSVRTLNWLWRRIVHPILQALGFADFPQSQSPKPHIWWIPTGKLTRLPLHAAGNHLQADGRTTLDMVVSSYASSIKAIVRARRQSTPMSLDASSLRVVAVAMEQTEGQRRLIYAAQEVDQVLSTLGIKATPQSRPRTYKQDVLSAIKACDIFHFAGHGQTHATAPLESSLLLSDWEKNPLTVQNFMEGDLANDNPFLAYLSACGTSRMKDEGALDENIHLVNACQLAGFRHVVGTLRSVDDEQCVQMARKVYEFMVKEGFRDDTVSRGLHYATKYLRDQWVQSHSHQESLQVAREAELIDDHISQPDWTPYIHFGI